MTGVVKVGSVVIAAHNEESVIGRCLDALEEGVPPGALDVVVVCNGCTDATATAARRHDVEVLELPVASKSAALNAGDDRALAFPRLYLDADVVLPGASVLAVLGRLAGPDGRPVAARPPLRYDTTGATALVRAYYRARSQTPALMGSLWGAGAFALSGSGRARFATWPDDVADDLFVDQQFTPDEVEIVSCDPVVVLTPRNVSSLLRILRRAVRDKSLGGGAPAVGTTRSSVRGLLSVAARHPRRGADVAAYLSLAVLARAGLRGRAPVRWERDDSSR